MSIKEENLIPVEGIIKVGQRLVKIGQIFVPIGFGGAFEPGAISFKEEGRDTYYKCASVGETTWDGYALVLGADGYYTISETLTTGLTYGIGYTPKVDGVYNANGTISVGKYNKLVVIPEDGLIFFAPLSAEASTAETGQALTTHGSVTYQTFNGVPCTYFDGSSVVHCEGYNCFALGTVGSMVVCFCTDKNTSVMSLLRIGYGGADTVSSCYSLFLQNGRLASGYNGAEVSVGDYTTGDWHILATTTENGIVKIYIDGQLAGTGDLAIECTQTDFYIGGLAQGETFANGGYATECFTGYLAGCCIYDRVLTDDEILQLSQELTPTV